MEANNNIEEIEQYLEGNLKDAALKEFEERLQTDKALANKVELIKNLDRSLADEKVLDVQKTVMDLGEDFFQQEATEKQIKPIKKIPFFRRPLGIAAALLLLVAFSFLIWSQFAKTGSTLSYQDLYANNYTPHQANDSQRGNAPDPSDYDQAVKQYQSKDFEAAVISLQKHLDTNPADKQAHYLLSHAHLNNTPPNVPSAINSFLLIIRDGNSILLGKAQWYLALLYLKQEKTGLAKNLLNGVAISEDEKLAEKAKNLLRKINAR